MSLDISPEIENVVIERAREEGVSVNDLLARTFTAESHTSPLPTDPRARVRALLAQWQATDNTPRRPPTPALPGETPSAALFRKWEEEAENMTEEECEQEETFWQEFQYSMNRERDRAGTRPLF